MSLTVRDIMNPQLLYVDGDDSAEVVREKLLRFGVSGAPVLDRAYRVVGFVSLRDISPDGKSVRVTIPAVTVGPGEPILTAARRLGERNLRHLVVADDRGVALGMVSALDFVRAFAGLPARHPAALEVDCSSSAAFPDGDGPTERV